MKKIAERYNLERISAMMKKSFGTVPEGEEDHYNLLIYPMEGNLIKLHRADPARNGRHVMDALHIALLTVDGYIRNIEYDFSKVIDSHSGALLKGLLMAFDPFTNEAIADIIGKIYDLSSVDDRKMLFQDPVRCLLRIEKSVRLWTDLYGINGYFSFIEDQIGPIVKKDDAMDYSVIIDSADGIEKLGIDVTKLEHSP